MAGPKRKSKVSTQAASEVNTPTADEDVMDIDNEMEGDATNVPDTEEGSAYDLLDDPWTTEQTTSSHKCLNRNQPAFTGLARKPPTLT